MHDGHESPGDAPAPADPLAAVLAELREADAGVYHASRRRDGFSRHATALEAELERAREAALDAAAAAEAAEEAQRKAQRRADGYVKSSTEAFCELLAQVRAGNPPGRPGPGGMAVGVFNDVWLRGWSARAEEDRATARYLRARAEALAGVARGLQEAIDATREEAAAADAEHDRLHAEQQRLAERLEALKGGADRRRGEPAGWKSTQ